MQKDRQTDRQTDRMCACWLIKSWTKGDICWNKSDFDAVRLYPTRPFIISIHLSIYIFIYLSIYLCIHLSIYLSNYMAGLLYVSLSFFLSIQMMYYICPSFCCIYYLSIYLCIYLSLVLLTPGSSCFISAMFVIYFLFLSFVKHHDLSMYNIHIFLSIYVQYVYIYIYVCVCLICTCVHNCGRNGRSLFRTYDVGSIFIVWSVHIAEKLEQLTGQGLWVILYP